MRKDYVRDTGVFWDRPRSNLGNMAGANAIDFKNTVFVR